MAAQPALNGTTDRAKGLRGGETVRAAADGRALDAAIEAAGSSRAEVAAAWAVHEVSVGRVAMGLRPLTLEKILRLPRAVRLALLASIVDADRAEQAQEENDLRLLA